MPRIPLTMALHAKAQRIRKMAPARMSLVIYFFFSWNHKKMSCEPTLQNLAFYLQGVVITPSSNISLDYLTTPRLNRVTVSGSG